MLVKILTIVAIMLPYLTVPIMLKLIVRQQKFRKHMIESRRCQLASLEALKNGNRTLADQHLVAAQAALDRAEFFA